MPALRPALAMLVLLGALLVAAGCGGSSSSSSESPDQWASGFCSSVTTWKDSVKSAGNELKSNPSKDSLSTTVDDIKSASDTLVSDLKDLGKPNTKQGQDAKDEVDQLSSELNDDVDQMKGDVKNVSGVRDVPTAVQSVRTTLSTMKNQVNSAVTKLGQANPDGELKQAFQDSSDCDSLTSSSS